MIATDTVITAVHIQPRTLSQRGRTNGPITRDAIAMVVHDAIRRSR